MARPRSKVKFDIGKVTAHYRSQVADNMQRAVFFLQQRSIDSLRSGDKTGRIYKRGSVEHRASAPGEAPATDTGRLQGAITTGVLTFPLKVIGKVIAQTVYAGPLELGTKRIKPRPFLRPPIDNNRAKLLRIISGKSSQ